MKQPRSAGGTSAYEGIDAADSIIRFPDHCEAIVLLTTDRSSATETCTCRWQGSTSGRALTLGCRRPGVRLPGNGSFRIVHEQLGRAARLP